MQRTTWTIAWRNLWRNRKRTALAVLTIAIGQWALLATQGMMRGYTDSIEASITGPMLGDIQINAPKYRSEHAMDETIDGLTAKLAAIRALPGVAEASARIYAPVLMAPKEEAYVAMVVGIDVADESGPNGLLAGFQGRLASHEVLLGYRLARTAHAKVGDQIALVGQAVDGSIADDLYRVAGIVDCAADLVNQSGVVMSLSDAQQLLALGDRAHEIAIRAERGEELAGLQAALTALPALHGLEIVSWKQIMPEMVMIMKMTGYSAYFILALMLIAAVAGIANTVMMSTYERIHEFGMLLALGCTPGRIVRMILMEALFVAVLGAVAGTAAGWGWNAVFARTGLNLAALGGTAVKDLAMNGLRLPLDIHPRLLASDPLVGLIAASTVSLLAALWPAIAAGRLDPMEALRQ
ncbi:MAG: ABC transporter permease [Planctomycetota bacterium]